LVKGGPAERSRKISPSDQIVGIDGTPIAPLNEKRVRELLLGPPGLQVSIIQDAKVSHSNTVREKADFEVVLAPLTFCVFVYSRTHACFNRLCACVVCACACLCHQMELSVSHTAGSLLSFHDQVHTVVLTHEFVDVSTSSPASSTFFAVINRYICPCTSYIVVAPFVCIVRHNPRVVLTTRTAKQKNDEPHMSCAFVCFCLYPTFQSPAISPSTLDLW